ncbi:MAG TPA: mechanosensitive ion channel family protein [Gemmatimonadetes bacterium]|nr:mechanosensitive ion channel family protein [Gemmatimonadota bacterium]
MIDFLSEPNFQRLAFLLGGLLLGVLVERVFFTQFQKFTKKTDFEWDDVIAHSFKGVLAVWFTAGGAYLALTVGDWDPLATAVILKVLKVLFILPVIVAAMRGVRAVVEGVSDRSQFNSPTLVVNLVRLAIGILGTFLILQNLDIDITPLITSLGIAGLAVALALQDTLGNLFAGVQIILTGLVKPGNYVQLSTGERGYIEDVKARNTTINTFPDGNLVVVPNATMASSIVKNYSMPVEALWVSLDIGVSYDSDLDKVEKTVMEVATEVLTEMNATDPTAEGPIVKVRFHTFGASSIDLQVRLLVQTFTSQGRVRHQFIKQLHKRFNEEGIEIPFPIRTLINKE